jgi:UDP-GlcNAc:undecaprenyl-phosphate/decaprenyl-phosphate GlcNAc-1-phosphate transferase
VEIIAIAFITAFFVVLLTTPALIKVAKLKHLVDEPKEARKTHRSSVPTIGGIIIFAAILFSYSLWFQVNESAHGGELDRIIVAFSEFKYLVAAVIILFFIGVKDDIIGTSPVKKLLGHILVAFILVMMADIRITSMHGLFGLEQIPVWASVFLSVFTYIVLVNAFNLIDGVDGLAAGVGFICACFFGTWFYLCGNEPFALLSFVLAGALIGFLVFNFSPARIFMGDSGSLVIGAIISVLAIRMIETRTTDIPDFLQGISTPVLAMSILVYPLIDTFRVFFYRAFRGISPFAADRNHLHHRLQEFGLSHTKTVLIIYTYNIVIVGVCLLTINMNPSIAWVIMFLIASALALLPTVLKPKAKVA